MGKIPVPCYQIGWVLFLALPQTDFVTPWKSLHLSDTVFFICAVGWQWKHAPSRGEEVKYSQPSSRVKLLLVLSSSSSSFTGERVTSPCKRQAEKQKAALSAPSHSALAIRPRVSAPWYCLEGSSAEGEEGCSPPRLSAEPSYSAKAADSYTAIYLFGCWGQKQQEIIIRKS